MAIVAAGFSFMIQRPASGLTPALGLLAAWRMFVPMVRPNASRRPSPSVVWRACLAMNALDVDGILVKCCKLHNAAMHGAGERVQRGIVFTGSFGEAGGVGRKVVAKAVEIDAFA